MKRFSGNSKREINTMVKDLQLIFNEAIKYSDVDFGVSQGARTIEEQQKYFDTKKSKINPRKYSLEGLLRVAKHIVNKDLEPLSRAGDIFAWVPGNKKLMWDVKHLAYLGGVITSTANRLYAEKKIKHLVRWGANWDKDGEIITDQTFQDLPHFEVYKP